MSGDRNGAEGDGAAATAVERGSAAAGASVRGGMAAVGAVAADATDVAALSRRGVTAQSRRDWVVAPASELPPLRRPPRVV